MLTGTLIICLVTPLDAITEEPVITGITPRLKFPSAAALPAVTEQSIITVAVLITFAARNRCMGTAGLRVTAIGSAPFAVITADGCSPANPIGTGVICRAGIGIIAGRGVIQMLTSCLRITAVIGADLPVITVKSGPCHTLRGNTGLNSGTDIIIVTVTIRIAFTA